MDGVLVTFLIVRRHDDQGILSKKAINWGLLHSFRGEVHGRLIKKPGGEQASMVLE